MKKIIILAVAVLALVLASVALAATPQGKLTGAADVSTSIGIERVVTNDVQDGETVYVAVNNDKSGDCSGDTGTVNVTYSDAEGGGNQQYTVLCAHFTGSGKMILAWYDSRIETWVLFRVIDKGSAVADDIVLYGTAATEADAISIVDLGTRTLYPQLTQSPSVDGNYVVHTTQ